jgi:glutaredoxin
MSDGFWSLRNAPAWWFDRRAWVGIALMAALLLGSRWYHGPGRVPARQVVVYGAAWCPYTQALGDHLAASGVRFESRDIDASFGNFLRYMWAAGRNSSLPVVQVGPRVVAKGFYRRDIDLALRVAGYQPAEGGSGAEGASARR